MDRAAHEKNRLSWNAVTPVHNRHKGDQGRFFREGGDTLFPEDHELLGTVAGLDLVHLQCNCGQDTLSIARKGARVTGVDISDEAVAFARQLSADAQIPATFHRSDLFEWLETTPERFDVAYTSYGALGWLSDLEPWGRGVARILRPGGRLVLIEFHPVMWMFDPQWRHAYPYSSGGRVIEDGGVNDYVAASAGGLWEGTVAQAEPWKNPHPTCEFAWGLGDVIGSLLRAGLRLDRIEEWPYTNGCKPFERMRAGEGRRWYTPDGIPEVPGMYGLVASRP